MTVPPRFLLLAGAWSAWVAVHLIRTGEANVRSPLERWMEAVGRWRAAEFEPVAAWPFIAGASGHAVTLGLVLVFAAAWAGLGGPLRRWCGGGGTPSRGPVRMLLGFGTAGCGLLGLALAGLWFPALMFVLPAAGLMLTVAGLAGRKTRLGERSRAGSSGEPSMRAWISRMPRPALAAMGAAVPVLLAAWVPDMTGDPENYHLAAPAQWLLAHRLDGFAPAFAMHFPMITETSYAFALILGRTELAHGFQIAVFAAGMAIAIRWTVEQGGRIAGWLAAAGIITCGTVLWQVPTAKSDLAVTAYILAGGVMAARRLEGGGRGPLALAALLLGFAAATKFSGLAIAVAAAGLLMGPFRSRVRAGWREARNGSFLACLPVLPWLVKNWLLVGDPLWPVLSNVVGGPLWDAPDARALALIKGEHEMTAVRWAGLAGWFPRGLAEGQPAAALAIPLAVLWMPGAAAGVRWVVALSLVGFLAIAIPASFEVARLALPAWLLFLAAAAVAVANDARGWRPGRARRAAWCAAALSWVPVGGPLVTLPDPGLTWSWLTGARSREDIHAAALTTYADVVHAMNQFPDSGRLILIGDNRFARYPARVVSERFTGRNFGWAAAGAAGSPDRIAVAMRQLGVRWIVYNVVWDSYPHPVQTAWTWDARRLEIWRAFVGRWLAVERWPQHADDPNGGFAVLGLRDRPLAAAPAAIPYLPGLQSLTFPITQAGLTGRAAEGAELALELVRRVPGVYALAELAGMFCGQQKRWEDAERVLRPGVLAGYPGRRNRDLWIQAMEGLGRRDEALRIIPAPRSPGSTPGR